MGYREATKGQISGANIPADVTEKEDILILKDTYSGIVQVFQVDPKLLNKGKAVPKKDFDLKRERDKMRHYFGDAGQPKGVDTAMAKTFMRNHGGKNSKVQEALCLAFAKFIQKPDKAYRLARSFHAEGLKYLHEIWIWRAWELIFQEGDEV